MYKCEPKKYKCRCRFLCSTYQSLKPEKNRRFKKGTCNLPNSLQASTNISKFKIFILNPVTFVAFKPRGHNEFTCITTVGYHIIGSKLAYSNCVELTSVNHTRLQ